MNQFMGCWSILLSTSVGIWIRKQNKKIQLRRGCEFINATRRDERNQKVTRKTQEPLRSFCEGALVISIFVF